MRRRPRKRLKEEDALEDSNVCNLCKEGPDEEVFGKYFVDKSSGFSVHQYCMFFASGLAQRGEDDEGFDGFLIKDIKKEISRSKRLRCNHCQKHGATIGCCNMKCTQTFHYKCGRQRGALFQFFDSFNSYCLSHRPTQGVNLALSTNQPCPICWSEIEWNSKTPFSEIPLVTPCCKVTWFHNSCLQKHAQSSGLHYFRCPVCNDTDKFQAEMKRMGIFIPEQDASWEKGDAYADLLFEYSRCDAKKCICPNGREHKETAGKWRIRLCNVCGQAGTHYKCQHWKKSPKEWYCDVCGAIESFSSTRQRQIGDRSEEVSHSEEDEDSSSAEEEHDVNVCSVSDDEISLATIRNRTTSTRQVPMHEGSIERRIRQGASPMRKRRRLSLEKTGSKTISSNDSKECYLKTSQNTSTSTSSSGLQLNDILGSTSMTSSVLCALSEAVDDMLVKGLVTSQESADVTAGQQTIKKDVETIVIDSDNSDNVSDSSVELVKPKIKSDKKDLKRKPIARCVKNSKSEDSTSSESGESSATASVNNPGKGKQNLGVSTRSRVIEVQADNDTKSIEPVTRAASKSSAEGKQTVVLSTRESIDVVKADSSAFSIKTEYEEVNLQVSDKEENVAVSDDDSCFITNVIKKPCPYGNDKNGMTCPLYCCNSKVFVYQASITSKKTSTCGFKDLQSGTVSSTSSTICDHVKAKSSTTVEQNQLSDTTSALTDKEEKGDVCSIGTNTSFKPSSRKKLSVTQTETDQIFLAEGKTPAAPHGRKDRLKLRCKKSGRYLENQDNKNSVSSCNAI